MCGLMLQLDELLAAKYRGFNKVMWAATWF
jgi:hypothetical protein